MNQYALTIKPLATATLVGWWIYAFLIKNTLVSDLPTIVWIYTLPIAWSALALIFAFLLALSRKKYSFSLLFFMGVIVAGLF